MGVHPKGIAKHYTIAVNSPMAGVNPSQSVSDERRLQVFCFWSSKCDFLDETCQGRHIVKFSLSTKQVGSVKCLPEHVVLDAFACLVLPYHVPSYCLAATLGMGGIHHASQLLQVAYAHRRVGKNVGIYRQHPCA